MDYIQLNHDNIENEHICCGFSDKKCANSYQAKKQWMSQQFEQGFVFQRLDERAKVFIEYQAAEQAWLPIVAPQYLALGCFWVSGKYKKQGHGKALLAKALGAAKENNKLGLVTVVGKKKYHFMSDTKWLLRQGFVVVDEAPNGFLLLAYQFPNSADEQKPRFADSVLNADLSNAQRGCLVYYSNRCPFAEYHVLESLQQSCVKRNIPLSIVKLDSVEKAQNCPCPQTIFSLYYQGQFITTDISACMDSRFDKFITP
ncbi:GNAT family N-acetyltransferase [Agarivorans sp. B2Z047]|uniref:GNAT family N-acetyltransferase n=1 Tax=Agarivorans sp. B2Z047 TaxID=2652721 RepID=UPI00128D9ACF|nr:GNAT family N-acetyltransferase [Agarivorans sp. B2Z047]MPW29435.1 GNAT family N-acetyltransferase [Agarivorans sp. B2Z047]UQN45024.1 YoaP domain-containing protein [Agarivorans sp. B2Z047]